MQATELEAKTKTCPFAHGFNHGQRKCEASGCMAWDWTEGEFEYYHGRTTTLYRGAAYNMDAFWPESSLPLGSDWTWESSIRQPIANALTFERGPNPPPPSKLGWWRRPKADRLGQCGRAMVLQIEQG